jgi:RNA polymerase sigma factor (sigma-70 family)
VIGLHFFNPVPVMKLVEIVRGPETSDETVAASVEFARRLGKEPIVVRDSPGFATSRLGVVLGLEAIRMVEQGVASAEAIDKAMELGYNHPRGPLRLTDHIGLDVRLRIAEYLWGELGEDQYRPPELRNQGVRDHIDVDRRDDEASTRVDLQDELLRALRKLPLRQRAAVVLRYCEGMSEHEVAEILDSSVGAVNSLVARGLASLRAERGGAKGE